MERNVSGHSDEVDDRGKKVVTHPVHGIRVCIGSKPEHSESKSSQHAGTGSANERQDHPLVRPIDSSHSRDLSPVSVSDDLGRLHLSDDGAKTQGNERDQMVGCGIHCDPVHPGDHVDSGEHRSFDCGQLIHLRITPDSRLINDGVEQFTQSMCLYKTPFQRLNGRTISRQPFLSFETILKYSNDVSYMVTVLKSQESVTRKAIETAWPRAKVEMVADPLVNHPQKVCSISMKYHYMFAIRVDRRENKMLASVLETLSRMEEGDTVYIQTLAEPAAPDWFQDAVDAYNRFKKGEMPQKFRLDKESMGNLALKAVATPVFGAVNVLNELIFGGSEEPLRFSDAERATILRDRMLRSESAQKVRGDAYDVVIRIGVVCNDTVRAEALMRMVTMAYREFDGDNVLVAKAEKPARVWKQMKQRKMGIRIQRDYMSIPELSRLHMLPSGALQEKYKMQSIKQLENDVQPEVLIKGLYIGEYEIKGKKQPVYFPLVNHDRLCLPRIVIGPMGCGKTKGYGANIAVEAVRNGFGSLVIDPAKGEMGDEIEASLPAEKVNRIRLGNAAISLDFCEVKHSERARSRLAKTIVSFFNTTTDEAGAQTSRYLKAAVMAMQTGKLSEIMRIFEDSEYRLEVIDQMRDSIHKVTLERFHSESDGRKNQILAPIYNRLDVILGDEYLEECMESDYSLDMVEIMSSPVATIIDVPKSELGPEGVDLIVNLISLKIDLAMTLRPDEKQFPYFIVFDEPHQFLKSVQIWKAAAVESRKWRVAYTWMFHSWEQIPYSLAEIIKSAGPHYTIYNASKKTFRDLAEEIEPFQLEDGLKLERFHAINVLRVSDEAPVPFIAKMALPPSMRLNNNDGELDVS